MQKREKKSILKKNIPSQAKEFLLHKYINNSKTRKYIYIFPNLKKFTVQLTCFPYINVETIGKYKNVIIFQFEKKFKCS